MTSTMSYKTREEVAALGKAEYVEPEFAHKVC